MPRSALAALVGATCLAGTLVAGCAGSGPSGPAADPGRGTSSQSGDEPGDDASTATDADAPLAWGPTAGELARAQDIVAGWDADRLAGQVIVGRFYGTDPVEARRLVRTLHLAGISIGTDSIVDETQVRALTAAVAQGIARDGRDWPAVIGVDQEGGVVSHLAGIATEFPSFATAGAAVAIDRRQGSAAVREAAYATGLELRDLGFTWVFAPVADVARPEADPVIGSRSPSGDAQVAARAVGAAVDGYDEAGVVSTTKHFPGHGSALADSHVTLPELDLPMSELEQVDLVPFESAIDHDAPAVMVGHLDVDAVAPGEPSSLAPEVYDLLRERLGFEGVAITDSMGMGAVMGPDDPVVQALVAGADLVLMPVDAERAHGLVVDAIESGELPGERIEEAAARVVALQLWQQRVAAGTPVPDDVTALAQAAAAALTAAGS